MFHFFLRLHCTIQEVKRVHKLAEVEMNGRQKHFREMRLAGVQPRSFVHDDGHLTVSLLLSLHSHLQNVFVANAHFAAFELCVCVRVCVRAGGRGGS